MSALSRAQAAYDNMAPPEPSAFDLWCEQEGSLIEALQSDEIDTAVTVMEELQDDFDAFVHLLAFEAPTFKPLCLTEFRRIIDGMTRIQLQEALDDGEIDPLEIVRLALFAPDEVRSGWPVVVRCGADYLHDRILAVCDRWPVVERAFNGRSEL